MPILRLCYNIILFILIPFIFPIGYLVAMNKKEEQDYIERFGAIKIPPNIKKSIWIHCASVGEVKSIKNLVKMIKNELPELSLLVSTTTYTGKQTAINELKPDFTFLMPLENSMAIKMMIDATGCKAMFIVDTELWPNTIYAAAKKTKLFMINARLSDRSFKSYKLLKFIFKPMLNKFDYIYAKSEYDVKKISEIKGSNQNIENIGNLKFFCKKKDKLQIEFEGLKDKKIAFASSTHKTEENIFLEAIKSCIDKFDYILIAPRHIKRCEEINTLLSENKFDYSLLSEKDFTKKFITVDLFGKLEELYFLSSKIFIGGSLTETGGHNIFEALQFEKIIATGPNMQNFKEIYEIAKKHNVIKTVENKEELTNYLIAEYDNIDFNSLLKEIESKNQANEKVFEKIKELVSD